jgi:hypothetical protein
MPDYFQVALDIIVWLPLLWLPDLTLLCTAALLGPTLPVPLLLLLPVFAACFPF